ncbi:hypothetical protein [uncultured Nonlabens sp.]|uniref:hypothetical protein n=1 Tax=uncultured Nonlabens sp. TaxID=859306 RepID=UPI002634BECD|nr:hypothetical protein [uncultured Nonlabens sp.]
MKRITKNLLFYFMFIFIFSCSDDSAEIIEQNEKTNRDVKTILNDAKTFDDLLLGGVTFEELQNNPDFKLANLFKNQLKELNNTSTDNNLKNQSIDGINITKSSYPSAVLLKYEGNFLNPFMNQNIELNSNFDIGWDDLLCTFCSNYTPSIVNVYAYEQETNSYIPIELNYDIVTRQLPSTPNVYYGNIDWEFSIANGISLGNTYNIIYFDALNGKLGQTEIRNINITTPSAYLDCDSFNLSYELDGDYRIRLTIDNNGTCTANSLYSLNWGDGNPPSTSSTLQNWNISTPVKQYPYINQVYNIQVTKTVDGISFTKNIQARAKRD